MTPGLFGALVAANLMTLDAAAFTTVAQARSTVVRQDFMAGLGDRPGTPVGEPLDLHPDLLILSVKGFLNDEECSGPTFGQGEEEVCLTACNKSNEVVYLDYHQLMPLYREVPGATPKQNLGFIGRGRISIAPQTCGTGGLDTREEEDELKAQAEAGTLPEGVGVRFLMKAMCLNGSRDVPDQGDSYDITSRLGHPQLKEIAALVDGKTLTDEGVDLVQDAFWEVTEYGGLTDEMRAKLRTL